MSSYSSSSLDEPLPAWTAYSPKRGISWSPKVVHVYDDSKGKNSDIESNDGDLHERKPLRRRASALSLSGGFSSMFGSLSNILGTPKLSRKNPNQNNTNMAKSTSDRRLKSRTMSDSALPIQRRSILPWRKRMSETQPMGLDETPEHSPHTRRITGSRDSLPSVNSDSAKSSMDSADDSTKAMDVFDESLSTPESSPEQRVPKNGQEPCFLTSDYNYRGVNIQDLVDEDVASIALDRRCLRTGRLVLNDISRSVCCGSVRTKSRTYPSCTQAATIHIYKDVNSRREQTKMIKDIVSLRRLRHRHITHVFGVCMEGSPITPGGVEVLVATQKAHFHLTLRRLLHWTEENNPQLLTPRIITTFGIHICHGLKYLEKQKILHTNLTTATVLLDSNCICKIYDIDFGPVEDRGLNTRWLPIESFLQSIYTYRSVVWTFGVLLWEMTTLGIQPYPHLTSINDIILYLAHGKRLIRSENCPRRLYRIMWKCWDEKPRHRPTFDDLVVMLTSLQQSLPQGKQPHEVYPDRDEFWEDNSWMDELDGVYDLTMM